MLQTFDVAVLADSPPRLNEAMSALGSLASIKLVNVLSPPRQLAFLPRVDVVNIDMRSIASLKQLKMVLAELPQVRRARIVAVEPTSHQQVTQSHAFGATSLLNRPFNARELVSSVSANLRMDDAPPPLAAETGEVARYAGSILRDMLLSVRLGTDLPLQQLDVFAGTLAESIAGAHVSDWLAAVRRNHVGTFEHSLTVTATAVAFGLVIGAGEKDLVRLSVCAMAHDLGKAFIPVEILEKPGKLDAKEAAMIKLHPTLGYEALRKSGASESVLDVTLNHHEYLDGTGYPNGLSGTQISDLTRVLTIADIFSALIERRSYKDPIDPLKAHDILVDMGPKLDAALVRAFRPVAERLRERPSAGLG